KSLLPCQWRRIIGTSPPLTSAKCKIIFEWGFFQQSAVKDAVMPDFSPLIEQNPVRNGQPAASPYIQLL
ncbi:hypothetical protein CTN06_17500, partial [Pectobacterium zantedeschiae]